MGPFGRYKGGVFAGCPPTTKIDHAISVVGYGRERGVDYWLIKNSWSPRWGENVSSSSREVSTCAALVKPLLLSLVQEANCSYNVTIIVILLYYLFYKNLL